MLKKLRDIILELTENIDKISFQNNLKIVDMVNNLNPVVMYLLQSKQSNLGIKENDILEMLQDTLIGIEQEDRVLLLDVLRYGWLPLLEKVENL